MALNKKMRFEVFKRDGFMCVYCGKTPPAVTLEVDHIDPKSNGGQDDINNLVTACFECNRGKRDIPLTKAPFKLSDNLEILQEQESQLRAYRQFSKKVETRVRKDIQDINKIYSVAYPGWEFSDRFKETNLKYFLRQLPKESISQALEASISKFPANKDRVINYFCGICWHRIRGTERPEDRE